MASNSSGVTSMKGRDSSHVTSWGAITRGRISG